MECHWKLCLWNFILNMYHYEDFLELPSTIPCPLIRYKHTCHLRRLFSNPIQFIQWKEHICFNRRVSVFVYIQYIIYHHNQSKRIWHFTDIYIFSLTEFNDRQLYLKNEFFNVTSLWYFTFCFVFWSPDYDSVPKLCGGDGYPTQIPTSDSS